MSSEPACPHLRKQEEEKRKKAAAAGGCPFHQEGKDTTTTSTSAAEPKRCPFHEGTKDNTTTTTTNNNNNNNSEAQQKDSIDHVRAALEASEAAAVAAAESGDLDARNRLMKEHFQQAYNALGSTHAHSGVGGAAEDLAAQRLRVAAVLVTRLGYTADQLRVIGDDVWKMQGTGNPHEHANISAGETVVDLGSGFGVDAFLAAAAVGSTGRVIGVDLSEREVVAAMKRAGERRERNVDFRIGDIEDIPVDDASVDCVISNGGFCLVPDKRKAFCEIFRVLRPGGRFSVSCTVKRTALDKGTKWPSCFHVFMPLDEVDDIITSAGLSSPTVDDSNSSMQLWDEDNVKPEGAEDSKIGIHRGDAAYKHLDNVNMDDLFARVTIYGSKPSN